MFMSSVNPKVLSNFLNSNACTNDQKPPSSVFKFSGTKTRVVIIRTINYWEDYYILVRSVAIEPSLLQI